ncbi:MAG TPA: M1 family metallopeptidase [Anaerolineales bacterium]
MKPPFHSYILAIALLIGLSACSVKGSGTVTAGSSPTPATETSRLRPASEIPASPASPAPRPAAQSPTPSAPASPNDRYTLYATLDYGQHHLAVTELITYTNRTTQALPDLVLMVDPMYFSGTFHLTSLTWVDGKGIDNASQENGQIHILLPQPLAVGAQVVLSISYELNLPSPVSSPTPRPVPFGYSARQTNLVNWYPFIPPYIPGKGWLAHPAGYFGEHLVYDVADFEVNIRLLDKRQDLKIAASAPAHQAGDWQHYELNTARNFAWSVSDQYQVMTETVGTVTVIGYAFPYDVTAGQAALKAAAQALQVYGELVSPYPRDYFSLVEADFLDGMEYDGLVFLSRGFYNTYDGTPKGYLTFITAHETAHQWWYALVGNDQALEPWLDESLTTYAERLFYERTNPDLVAWWWSYRVDYYEPQGAINRSIYDFQSSPQPYTAYRNTVYLNGAHFLEDLRRLIGDEAFFAFLKDFTAQNAHRLATTESFFSILKAHTQADLTPLLKKYFSN